MISILGSYSWGEDFIKEFDNKEDAKEFISHVCDTGGIINELNIEGYLDSRDYVFDLLESERT